MYRQSPRRRASAVFELCVPSVHFYSFPERQLVFDFLLRDSRMIARECERGCATWVHCAQGFNRGPSGVLAFLLLYTDATWVGGSLRRGEGCSATRAHAAQHIRLGAYAARCVARKDQARLPHDHRDHRRRKRPGGRLAALTKARVSLLLGSGVPVRGCVSAHRVSQGGASIDASNNEIGA